MELVFQEDRLEYLGRTFCETMTLEQTADLIVPDSYSDCERVVDAFGTVLIRAEECVAGAVSVSGVVQAGVLFVTEDGAIERLETQIPFSARRELSGEPEERTLQCRCMLRSVDARLLNSRKLLVRVGISCMLTVYARRCFTAYDMQAPAPALQLKRTRLPLRMPVGLGEKSFPIHEELELPEGKHALARLLRCLCSVQVQEQKMVGDKAVFKGALCVHALYADTDDALQTHDWTLPFSQYAQTERELDESELQTVFSLISFEVEPEGTNDCRRLFLSANVLAQCTVFGRQELSLIEDAFCTDAELNPVWQDCTLTGVLDRQVFHETAVAELEARRLVDAWIYPEEAQTQRTEGTLRLELPLNCNALYYDETGALQGTILRLHAAVETELSENGNCAVSGLCCGEIAGSTGGSRLGLRVPLTLTVESSAEHRLHTLCGAELQPLAETQARRPAVILRRTDAEEELWEIAKRLRAPVQSILEANDLASPNVPANTMLLIPT